jgi:hypothetical protein
MNALTTYTLISTARSLFRVVAAMIAPCSVNAQGRWRRPPQLRLEVTDCDLKIFNSAFVTRKTKSSGNRRRFRFTA